MSPHLAFPEHQLPWLNWWSLTGLGDTGLLVPAAAVIAIALALHRPSRPQALRWILICAVVGVLLVVTKLAYVGWGMGSISMRFTGLSGHAALAALVWPILLWLMTAHASSRVRIAAILLGGVLAVGIAVSRLVLQAHSVSEALLGFLVGAIGSTSYLMGTRQLSTSALQQPALIRVTGGTLLLALALMLHGRPTPTEEWLYLVATDAFGVAKPFHPQELLYPTPGSRFWASPRR